MGTGKDEEVIQFFLPKSDNPTSLDLTLAKLKKKSKLLAYIKQGTSKRTQDGENSKRWLGPR